MLSFSMIIPVYNTPSQLLQECFESIQNQKRKDLEVIIVNDGSDEETRTFLEKYCAKAGFILINKSNGGVSSARNVGIEASHGDYILFCDPDDFLENYYFDAIDKMIVNGNDLIIFSYSDLYLAGKRKAHCINDKSDINVKDLELGLLDYRNRVVPYFFGACWNCVYKKSILLKYDVRFKEDLVKNEDTIFNLAYLEHVNSFDVIDDSLYVYRYNENSACHAYNPKCCQNGLLVYKEIDDLYADKILSKAEARSLLFFAFTVYRECLDLYFQNPNSDDCRSIMKEKWIELVEALLSIQVLKHFDYFELLHGCKRQLLHLLCMKMKSFFWVSKIRL